MVLMELRAAGDKQRAKRSTKPAGAPWADSRRPRPSPPPAPPPPPPSAALASFREKRGPSTSGGLCRRLSGAVGASAPRPRRRTRGRLSTQRPGSRLRREAAAV